jgi:hypothetical protein
MSLTPRKVKITTNVDTFRYIGKGPHNFSDDDLDFSDHTVSSTESESEEDQGAP